MKLEFRTKDGARTLTILKDMLCIGILHNISISPEFNKTTKKLGNDKDGYTEYQVFTCTQACKFIFAQTLDIDFDSGDYIKVLNS
jgi:hypothetical protein